MGIGACAVRPSGGGGGEAERSGTEKDSQEQEQIGVGLHCRFEESHICTGDSTGNGYAG